MADRDALSAQLSLDVRGLTVRVDDWHGPVNGQLRHDLEVLRAAITMLLRGDAPELDYAPFSGRRVADEPAAGVRISDTT